MTCDDFVEYMRFPCGLEVRITWSTIRPPGVAYLNRVFDRVDNLHGERCIYCKESSNDTT